MATQPRNDEVVIDEALVARLVADQFPQWADRPVAPVPRSGVDNATFRLGDDMLVRMPRFDRWVGQVTREQHWLPRLAPHLPLAVPTPLAQGEPGAGYGFPWSVYDWLPGDNAEPENIDDPVRAAVDLAGFLLALQAVDPRSGPPPEASNGFRGAALDDPRDSPVIEWRIRGRIEALDGLVDTGALTEVYEAALATPAWAGEPVWIHGDPAPTNLLATAGRLSAVIDFGTLAVGDPACDLIAAWTFCDAGSRDLFRSELGVDDATWARGRGWGLSGILPSPADLADPVTAGPARLRIEEIIADHRQKRL